MKKENKIVKFLVPVAAVVVLIESVILITNLTGKKDIVNISTPTVVPVVTEKAAENAVYQITVVSAAKDMKLNQPGTIEVQAVGNSDKSLDSVSIYLKYDPAAFEVSNLTFDKKLGTPTFSKISPTTGLVVANFLISAPEGIKVTEGEILSLMKFNTKPIKTGVFDFEISVGNEVREAATMLVESVTGKVLPFSGSKLTVNVSR